MRFEENRLNEIKRRIIILCIPTLLLFISVLMNLPRNPLKEIMMECVVYLDSIKDSYLSMIVFVILNLIGLIIFLPITFLTLTGGFVFGYSKGLVLNIISRFIGSIIPYFIGRYIAKRYVIDYLKSHPKTDQFISLLNDDSTYLLCLYRMCPIIPFTISNYILSPFVDPSHFFISTLIGIIPLMIIHTYFGTVIHDIVEIVSTPSLNFTFLNIIVLIGMIVLTIVFFVVFSIKIKEISKNQKETPKEVIWLMKEVIIKE
ncbi:hypothetical protein, conserved [Entamoeba dispar SAW760]|uniref:VTT domain-containing protein n=1 Tax=Entamoeba dispar (strain ATCC PRA-260 / SAW760) TaxID=370354 RepID=B0E8H6_ENTDS|nr:uncharacterized protein EDI_310920 [Entamoeba dispar SAW760]EDR29178.1 hypothetical protein, conserved [Entamoeba dispar SAW760]|eukprot:EDR29178.1 hypothetical protein, conserved [Entamoeba dispar SAW760]